MDSLKQYLDLYKSHSDLIDRGSVHFINGFRKKALESLEKNGLPKKGSEGFETTDLNEIFAPDFGLNLSRINIDVNAGMSFHCGVPSISASVYFLKNDIFEPDLKSQNNLPEGVFVGSLTKFSKDFPEIAEKYYGKAADLSNTLVALNSLLVQDGIAVYVPKHVKLEKPIQIVNILENGMPLMAVRRLLVILEEGAEAKILACDHTQNGNIDFLNLQVSEIFVAPHAVLDFYELEESTEKTSRLAALYLEQEAHCDVNLGSMTLFNGKTRNECYCRFNGEDARLSLKGMGIEDRNRHLDNYTSVCHGVPSCKTEELYKYVVDDESVGAFYGRILVDKGAHDTEAFQSNRNIVGSEKARMFSKPQLEIYNDDVKCSHGCAIGQLDENQVFYMQTRGIPENEAKFLLKQAFMADVVDGIRIPGLHERLLLLVEKRFAGESIGCSSCNTVCGK